MKLTPQKLDGCGFRMVNIS